MVLSKLFCKHLERPLVFLENIIFENNDKRSVWKCPKCNKIILRPYHFIGGEVSDGNHTFNELYHHRAILFSVICNTYKNLAWKSKKHDDGSMYDGMFIVGIKTPEDMATYHYYIEPYWDMFNVPELEYAPEWDGHTPDDAIKRIASLNNIAGVTKNMVDTFVTTYKRNHIHRPGGFVDKYCLSTNNL